MKAFMKIEQQDVIRLFSLTICLVLILVVAGCQKAAEEETEEVVGERVENAQVGVALAALPSFFKVVLNEGDRVELVPADGVTSGRLTIVAGEKESGGINLVAAWEKHKEEILAREGGEYKGQMELGSQLGTTFYSRGRYPAEGTLLEETIFFLIHPWQDRTLQLIYRYPAGEDSKERIEDHMFSVLGEVEGLPAPAEESAEG